MVSDGIFWEFREIFTKISSKDFKRAGQDQYSILRK